MKKELKHTKGEWKIFWGNYGTYCSINKDTSCRIATIKISKKGEIGNAPIEEAHANALLIAAAPELLNALQKALEVIERLSDEYSDIAKRHASYTVGESKIIEGAIRKTTGE